MDGIVNVKKFTEVFRPQKKALLNSFKEILGQSTCLSKHINYIG